MTEPTILFVDDEQSILSSLQRTLRKEPYRVLTAVGGEKGLEVLESEAVDLVVSDQRMPGMTGTEFLMEVGRRYPEIVRVILSGYAEPHIIVDAINSGGIYRFLAKPWDDVQLKANLRQCLEHHRLLQDNRRLSALAEQQIQDLERLNQHLEAAVALRTRSLAFAQDILEALPRIVLGVSCENELVLSNAAARDSLASMVGAIPGSDIGSILPEAATDAIRRCQTDVRDTDTTLAIDGTEYRLRATPLGSAESRRGCVVLLEEVCP